MVFPLVLFFTKISPSWKTIFNHLKIYLFGKKALNSLLTFIPPLRIVKILVCGIKFREVQYQFHQILLRDLNVKQTRNLYSSYTLLKDQVLSREHSYILQAGY